MATHHGTSLSIQGQRIFFQVTHKVNYHQIIPGIIFPIRNRSNSAERFNGFKTSGESDNTTRSDRNQTAENSWYDPENYSPPVPEFDEFSTPVPEGIPVELATCLPASINVLAHAAIAGKTMAQFRIELSGTMHHGTGRGATRTAQLY